MSESTEVMKKLDKAVASVTKGNDRKEEMMMMVAPYANWGEYIVPAPISIALLGELILISADTDFSLEKKPPKDGFQLLRYPNSFRACLVQVSNAGWEAFNEAHTNMDQIRLLSANVDAHVKNAVKFLVAGSNKEVEVMVPKALKNVERIADDCVSLVTSVEDKFLFVMKLTGELLEACTNAKGQYEEELKDTEIALKITREHEKASKEQKENAAQQFKEMQKDMEANREEMKKAVESMPSGWDLVGMSVVESLTNSLTMGLSAFVSRAVGNAPQLNQNRANYGINGEYEEPNPGVETPEQAENRRVYSKAPELMTQVLALECILNRGKPNWKEAKKGDRLSFITQRVTIALEYVQRQGTGPVQAKALELFEAAKVVCSELGQAAKDMVQDEAGMKKTVERFEKLKESAQDFDVRAKRATGVNPMNAKGPQLSKVQRSGGASSSATDAAVKNAQFRVDTAKEILKSSQQQYDAAAKSLKESNDELGKVLADLAKYDMKKIDFQKIRETLIRGIRALANLREQWGKMVRFFQMISNLIKCSMSTSLKGFVESTESGQKMVLQGFGLSSLMRDTIYEQAFQANKISYVVHMISETYVQISKQYLMDRITCLGQLVALDTQKDAQEISQKRQQLHAGCKQAQDAIGKLVMEKRQAFDEQMDNRVAKIEKQFEGILPARSPAAIEESQASIKKSLDNMEQADLDQFC